MAAFVDTSPDKIFLPKAGMLPSMRERGAARAGRAFATWRAVSFLACTGCGQASAIQLTVPTWWQSDSEKAAFKVLRDAHTSAHPNVTFDTDAYANVEARQNVAQQLLNGAAPDTFEANMGLGLLRWASVTTDDQQGPPVSELDDVSDVVSAEWLTGLVDTSISKAVQLDGKVYGVPINVHTLNRVYFRAGANPLGNDPSAVLCEGSPPSTPLRLALNLNTDGVAHQLVLETLLPLRAPDQDFYQRFFQPSESDDLSSDTIDRNLESALKCAEELHTRVDLCETAGWVDSLEAVKQNTADFTITGDWATGESAPATSTREVQGLESSLIGSFVVFTSDVFPLPLRSPHVHEVQEFLNTLMSPNVQRDFSKKKGSIPAIRMTDVGGPDKEKQEEEFNNQHRKLLAMSALLPPNYPANVADLIKALIRGPQSTTQCKDMQPKDMQPKDMQPKDMQPKDTQAVVTAQTVQDALVAGYRTIKTWRSVHHVGDWSCCQ